MSSEEITTKEQAELEIAKYTEAVVAARTQILLESFKEAIEIKLNLVKEDIAIRIAKQKKAGKTGRQTQFENGYIAAFKELYTVIIESIEANANDIYINENIEIAPADYDLFAELDKEEGTE